MKFCENCGTQLEDNALFCEECGAKQELVEEVIASVKAENTLNNPQEDTSNEKQANYSRNDNQKKSNGYIDAFEEDEVEVQESNDKQAIAKVSSDGEVEIGTLKMICILIVCSPFIAGAIASLMPSFLEYVVVLGLQIYALALMWTKSGWKIFTKIFVLLLYALHYYIALII